MILDSDLFDLNGISEIGDSTIGIYASTKEGKYYWGVSTEYDDIEGEKIPKYLYDALIQYGLEKEEEHKKKYLTYLEAKNKMTEENMPLMIEIIKLGAKIVESVYGTTLDENKFLFTYHLSKLLIGVCADDAIREKVNEILTDLESQ